MSRLGDTSRKIRLYVCECGPIIKDAIDLDRLVDLLSSSSGVSETIRYPTLCSETGRAWLADDLASHPGCRVVVAGCSPREHSATFMTVCALAGVNPYLFAMANIREQCTWVTPDRSQAADKALAIIHAAVARVLVQEPLAEREFQANCDALVVGAGVAGLTAAQMLANAGRRVYLVERSPCVGGRAALLSDIFPNMECASCLLEELMDEVLHHPQIEVFTYSELIEALGYFGNFTVRIRKRARHVNRDECYGCRTCHDVCPVEVPNDFDQRLSSRKAIYIPYEGALPNATLIDEANCLHFRAQSCDACVTACPFGNIDLNAQDELLERQVGAIILATGAEPHLTDIPALSPRVITAMAMERLLNSAGPTRGRPHLPDQDAPSSIALVQCADHSGRAPSPVCSKICCMASAKYVLQLHEKLPDCKIYQLSWDRCFGGKGFREFAARSQELSNLHHLRLKPSDRVNGFRHADGHILIDITKNSQHRTLRVDLAVLTPCLAGSAGAHQLASLLRLDLDAHAFLAAENERLRPFRTPVDGVFVAGCARGPADIQDSAAQAAAAAGSVLAELVPGRSLTVDPATAVIDQANCGGCQTCVVTCPYKAITFDPRKRIPEVNDLLCRGCGSCAAACPTGAVKARHFTDEQIEAELDVHSRDVELTQYDSLHTRS